MVFSNLSIREWKQFQNVDIDFHPRLTILTGANGSGKTTMLNLLAKHFDWNVNEVATPAKDKKTGLIKFFARFFKKSRAKLGNEIGHLEYENGQKATLSIPEANNQVSYPITIKPMQTVLGFYVPSQRGVYFYREVPQFTTKKREKQQAFSLVSSSIKSRSLGGGGGQPSNYYIKETLLSWAIAGAGNEFIEADAELIGNFRGFENVLRKVLPEHLGFEGLTIRNFEVVLITSSGDFLLDAVSGGVSSLIDLSWQIYTFHANSSETRTILIDEVENHLHASMQRAVLPDFTSAFPDVQFIVSTHSPLIIGSVKDSNIYALRYDESNKVFSEPLDLVNRAKTATEILNEVLGVPFTMPIWVEQSLDEIVAKYSLIPITKENFDQMRSELSGLGLESLMPLAIKQTLEK